MLKIHPAGLGPNAPGTFVLLVVFGLSGCRSKVEWPIPKTYPVTGKVVVSQGQIPVGATIEFTASDPELNAEGRIATDGSFTLNTLFHEKKLSGATEGLHHVTLRPPGAHTIVIKDTYTIEPKENHFIVKLNSVPIPRGQDRLPP